MKNNEQILIDILFKSIEVVNATLHSNSKIRKDLNEILAGPNSSIESITLVNLLLELEIQAENIGLNHDIFAVLDNIQVQNLKVSDLLNLLISGGE